jgi:peptidoglycan/LPS O-acetylase OafA/YrhL
MGSGKRSALSAGPTGNRLQHLDGLRGIAALFVLIHHSFCMAFPIGLGITATGLTAVIFGWVVYGHFGVTVFIVLAGYLLAMGPAGRQGQLSGGLWVYLRKRAWRIMPPYWAALVLTLALSLTVVGQKTGTHWDQSVSDDGINPLAYLIDALLLQDVLPVQNAAYTFWSVAVEWHIYLLLPLMLLIRRRSTWVVAIGSGILLGGLGIVGSQVIPSIGRVGIASLWPTYYVAFALAVGACVLVRSDPAWLRHVPWVVVAVAFLGVVIGVCIANPYAWVADNYYWIDLLVACASIAFVVAMATGRANASVAFLSWKPVAGLGVFSYSLYLVHAPLLQVFWQLVVQPLGLERDGNLLVIWALGVPAMIASAYVFYRVAERPFVEMAQRRQASATRSKAVLLNGAAR